jgi:septum formation protein
VKRPFIHLASGSPRRRELLDQIGIDYQVVRVAVDEAPLPNEAPAEYVMRLAIAKATAGREVRGDGIPVLGADTSVVIGDEILGKPMDREGALEMLMRLSGREHQVMTGVALLFGEKPEARLSVSFVEFNDFDEATARAYVATGEPSDKAGGYGIQGLGAILVRSLRGSYSGVMGLPLFETAQLLELAGLRVLETD